jgi:hypothetical protein
MYRLELGTFTSIGLIVTVFAAGVKYHPKAEQPMPRLNINTIQRMTRWPTTRGERAHPLNAYPAQIAIMRVKAGTVERCWFPIPMTAKTRARTPEKPLLRLLFWSCVSFLLGMFYNLGLHGLGRLSLA